MNLLDLYILEVGKHLPRKNRGDLQAEIRSTLEDMLEDRSRQSGRPIDDALIGEVLQEYGAPAKVAEAYRPARYLVGPQLFPFFEMVVKIVLAVLTVVTLIRFGVSITATPGQGFLSVLGKYGFEYLGILIGAFGNIALVFAILERVLPVSKFEEETEDWSPADLNAMPDPDVVKRSEMIFEILFTALGLAVLNLYPDGIGIFIGGGERMRFPVLSEAFFQYLPWINLLGGLQILLDVFLLRRGTWKTSTRIWSLALDVAGIALAWTMLLGPSLVNLSSAMLAAVLGDASPDLLKLFNFLPQMVLIILIIVQSVEVVGTIRQLLTSRNAAKALAPRS